MFAARLQLESLQGACSPQPKAPSHETPTSQPKANLRPQPEPHPAHARTHIEVEGEPLGAGGQVAPNLQAARQQPGSR